MTRVIFSCMFRLLVPIVAAGVLAQSAAFASSIGRDAPVTKVVRTAPGEAERVLNRFGRCLAKLAPEVARTVLEKPLRDGEQLKAASRLRPHYDACFRVKGTALTLSVDQIYGALAEGLLQQQFGDEIPAVEDGATATALNAAETYALCLVGSDPEVAWRVVMSEPASEDEAGLIAQIGAQRLSCAPPGPAPQTRFEIRNYLAVGLYRQFTAPRR